MKEATSPAVQRLTWIRWSCTTALGLSLWCATAALAFDAQGHRGARGLAPENTLAAFDRALSIGVTTLELDVVLSAEGVPVISHDTTPNPDLTRDAGGRWLQARGQPFNRLTLAEIAEWDVGRINPASRYARDFAEQTARDGQRIPTLAALFQRVRQLGAQQVRFNIELKIHPGRPDESPSPDTFVRAVLQVVNQARAEATAQRRPVSVCGSLNGLACSNDAAAWSTRVISFVDCNGNGTLDAPVAAPACSDRLLFDIENGSPGVTTAVNGFNNNRFGFNTQGFLLNPTTGTIRFCDGRGATAARAWVAACRQ